MKVVCPQTVDEQYHQEDFDGYIDLGRELSVLHSMLEESLQNMTQVQHVSLHYIFLNGSMTDSEIHIKYPTLDVNYFRTSQLQYIDMYNINSIHLIKMLKTQLILILELGFSSDVSYQTCNTC